VYHNNDELSRIRRKVRDVEMKSRLSKQKQRKPVEYFVVGATARSTSEILCINKNTVAFYFNKLKLLIYENAEECADFTGETESDESYFGGVRKGKRGRGAAGKVSVFGIPKRGGKVYTAVINNTKRETLHPI
jgi:transposase